MILREGSSTNVPPAPRVSLPALLSLPLAPADWLHNRLRRRMLQTFPFSHLRARDYHKRLATFSAPARSFQLEKEICTAFAETGALVLGRQSTASLFGMDLAALSATGCALLMECQETHFENEAALIKCPDFYRLGLSPAILDLAEACLGLECLYLGATLKREVADGHIAGTRQWHLDIEDEKLFRILIYLTPVTADGGPFEFFPRAASRTIKDRLHYRSGYVTDARMNAVAPMQLLQRCIGDAGDAVVFDGAGVFHRGCLPLGQDRYSITFAYCSRRPLELRPSARLPTTLHKTFLTTLTSRQRRAVPPPRSF